MRVVTAVAMPLCVSVPRALRLARRAGLRAATPAGIKIGSPFTSKLANMTLELRQALSSQQREGATLREQLEALTTELASNDVAGTPSLREQLQALTAVLRANPPEVRDNLLDASLESDDDEDGTSASDSRAEPLPPLDVERVWTTLLVLSVLERFSESCLFSDDGDRNERTIVDAGYLWLEEQASNYPALAALLEDGSLKKRAQNATARWQAVLGNRVAEIRRAEAITSHLSVAHLQRTSAEITRALMLRHETFSAFMAPAMDGLQRWQMWSLLLTVRDPCALLHVRCA